MEYVYESRDTSHLGIVSGALVNASFGPVADPLGPPETHSISGLSGKWYCFVIQER